MKKNMEKVISSGLEDYIEAIYVSELENRQMKGAELARLLEVSRASVSEALIKLSDKGLVNYESYGKITLTDEGKRKAKTVYEKHNILKKFFTEVLLADEADAEETACKIEHIISRNILNLLNDFTHFAEENVEIVERFRARILK